MKRTKLGFTLIELMIAVVILATLAALSLPAYTSIIKNNHLKNARANILQIEQNMERYYAQRGTYIGAAIPAQYSNTEKFNFILQNRGTCEVANGLNADKYCIVAIANNEWINSEERFLVRDGDGEVFTCNADNDCYKN